MCCFVQCQPWKLSVSSSRFASISNSFFDGDSTFMREDDGRLQRSRPRRRGAIREEICHRALGLIALNLLVNGNRRRSSSFLRITPISQRYRPLEVISSNAYKIYRNSKSTIQQREKKSKLRDEDLSCNYCK